MENKEIKIDNIIKNSYLETQVPKNIFEEAYNNLDENKNGRLVMKYATGIAAVIVIMFAILIFKVYKDDRTKENEYTPIVEGKDEEIESKLPVASDSINTLGDSYQSVFGHLTSPKGASFIEEHSQFVVVVKVEKILGYTNYIKRIDQYNQTPFIISKVSVEKVFKGDLNGEIEIMSYGGVISVSDYQKSLLPGMTGNYLYSDLTDEEKENTYIRILNSLTFSTIEPDEGKYYLVFMNYSENLESYQVLDDLIYEYDIENDRTKNTDTNKWEDYEFGKR